MSDRRPSAGGSRLSPQTLIVASLASLTAAIVTSTFWQRGTPVTAAITPVIVALASELYSRPAQQITRLGARARTREQERVAVPAWRDLPDERPPLEPPEAGPIRIYRTSSAPQRRIHPKVILATAAVAFAIAIVALTLPELVFGGSVASHGSTTFFGSGRSHNHKSSSSQSKQPTTTAPTSTAPTQTTTAPTQSTTTPAPPAQTVPQTTSPAPSSGVAPPAQGTTGPSG